MLAGKCTKAIYHLTPSIRSYESVRIVFSCMKIIVHAVNGYKATAIYDFLVRNK